MPLTGVMRTAGRPAPVQPAAGAGGWRLQPASAREGPGADSRSAVRRVAGHGHPRSAAGDHQSIGTPHTSRMCVAWCRIVRLSPGCHFMSGASLTSLDLLHTWLARQTHAAGQCHASGAGCGTAEGRSQPRRRLRAHFPGRLAVAGGGSVRRSGRQPVGIAGGAVRRPVGRAARRVARLAGARAVRRAVLPLRHSKQLSTCIDGEQLAVKWSSRHVYIAAGM